MEEESGILKVTLARRLLSAKEVEKPEEVRAEIPGPTGTERILTVDDESLIVGLHNAVLTDLGYTVTSMTSSEKALAAFKNNPQDFDLLITDQTMPAMTGAKLAQKVLHIRHVLKILTFGKLVC